MVLIQPTISISLSIYCSVFLYNSFISTVMVFLLFFNIKRPFILYKGRKVHLPWYHPTCTATYPITLGCRLSLLHSVRNSEMFFNIRFHVEFPPPSTL